MTPTLSKQPNQGHATVLLIDLPMCEDAHLQKLVKDCRRYRLDASAMTYERASSCQYLQRSAFSIVLQWCCAPCRGLCRAHSTIADRGVLLRTWV